jgi:type I restriction enzyme S subunit
LIVARLGNYIREERRPLGSTTAADLQLIGVSNELGLHVSSRDTSEDLSRYQRIEKDWFAYNPMRVNVGSIGLADHDSKIGFTSPDYTVFSCRKGLDPHFLLHFLKSDYGLEAIARNCSGAVRKRLYFSGLSNIELPIPGIDEQRSLIAKIQKISETIRFVREQNSDRHELPQLKQAILQAAIQGKLTADWRAKQTEVEPASRLLQSIRAEKARLVAAEKIRFEKALPKINAVEMTFEIPNDWEWCHFGDLMQTYEAGNSFKCDDREITGQEWGVIKTSAVTSGNFVESENKFLSTKAPNDISAQVKIGDLIFCRASGSKGLAGMCATVRDCSRNLLLSDKTIRVRLMDGVNQEYIALHNASTQSRAYFAGLNTGKSTSMNNVTRGELLRKPVPLPPPLEQAAIVRRVETLMGTCRSLEAEINSSRAHASHLLQAVLKAAFAPPRGTLGPLATTFEYDHGLKRAGLAL